MSQFKKATRGHGAHSDSPPVGWTRVAAATELTRNRTAFSIDFARSALIPDAAPKSDAERRQVRSAALRLYGTLRSRLDRERGGYVKQNSRRAVTARRLFVITVFRSG
ncbi:MAG: hypothetical protein DME99_07725 [Verrucomicrobia bacterium]|nr:MAG: hypothetical protein DME99_07725 [Verrucomicrobiota bacterium]